MSVAAAWWPPSPTPTATSSGCSRTDEVGHRRACTGGNDEREEGHAEVRQQQRDRQEVRGTLRRRTGRDEGAHPRAEGGSAPRPLGQGRRGKRRARQDRRDAGAG